MAEGEEREDKRAVDEFLKAEGSKHKEFVEISLKAGVTYSSLLNFLKIKPRKLVPVEVKRHQIEISSLNQSRRMECAKRDAEDLEIVQKKVKIDPVISSGTTGIDQQPENEDLQDAVMEPFHLECLDKFREGIEMSRPWDFVRLVAMKETPKPEDDLKAENQKIIDHHVVENGKTSPPDNHSTNVPDNFITIEDTLPQNHSSNVRVPEFSQDSKATIAAVADFFKSFSSDELAEFSKDE